jgi:hypothetical protein
MDTNKRYGHYKLDYITATKRHTLIYIPCIKISNEENIFDIIGFNLPVGI